ncbi:MAG: DUF5107 domain-containing protein [Chloroflexota bacterium]|nr:DUF5107 domain-containing protein [Chloroflexota bacterium]
MKRWWKVIILVGLLALLSCVSTLQHQAAYSGPAGGPAEVAILQAASWPVSDAEVETLVRQAVALAGGLDGIVSDGDKVVVKPNLVWGADPDEGYTTDPRVTRAVVQLAQEAGAEEILIADGAALYRDGHNARGATGEAFRLCGYDADGDMVDDTTGAPLVDLNDSGGLDQYDPNLVRQVHLQNGLIWSDYWLPNVILDADVLIGVPVLKNHSCAGISLALKNQFGIPPSDIYHRAGSKMFKWALSHGAQELGRHIVDLNLARPLDFVVLDGLRGMTDGPIGGTLMDPPLGLILAGADPVALDTVGALVMGYDPATIPYLGWAAGAGLGSDDVAQITVHGQHVSQVRRDFPAPYGDPPAQRAETTPPSVDIISPGEGYVVVEETIVWATASDDSGVSKVEFYAGDSPQEMQAVITTPPYQARLDLSAFRGQTVTLRAVAYDYALNETEDSRTVMVVPAPAPGTASLQTATLTIPTYPYTAYLTSVYTPTYNMTYTVLDWDAYNSSGPTPVPQDYQLLVLENDYLRVTLMPELGGRIYQMIFKPTGHNELYQNPVIKPNIWGPPEQGWWLAAGGIEWCLPVEEHGYEWGEPWAYQVVTSTAGITVTLQDTTASDRIRAEVTLHLPASRGYLAVTPRIENPTGSDVDYKFWLNALLAPGAANTVSADLHFVFDTAQMTVHSTGDEHLPDAGQPMDWPVHDGRDYSRLGNWERWLGFFERPQATAGFAGVYDAGANEGLARIFPPSVARGSKGFGFGWSNPIPSDIWTDGGSTYVELHGGIAPTFWDTATITAGQSLEWTEYWYPVSDIGQLSAATAEAALGVRASGGRFTVGVHSTTPRAAGTSTLYAWHRDDCTELGHWALPAIGPGEPFTVSLATEEHTLDSVAFVYLDVEGNLLAAFNPRDCLPPTSSVEPLPPWVGTPSFTVAWAGQDAWSGVETYDVQVRDGYAGTWVAWLTNTTTLSDTFTGAHGQTYFFRARARDQVGNEEPFSDGEWGQAFTTVLTEPAPVLVTSRKSATPDLFHPAQTVAYTIVISNTGNLAATAVLTDVPPAEMVVLTGTLTATSAPPPTYAGGQIHWSGTVTPGSEVRVTYALSPTAATPFGVPLTNTAEIAGSVLGPITRREAVVQAHLVWLPLIARGWEP